MKLWIIYKEGIGFSKLIAEMLQDRLDDYIDVSVGNAKKIDPAFLVEERVDILILGDILSEEVQSLEIQTWILKYWEVTNNSNNIPKAVSGFYITSTCNKLEPFWIKFLQSNINIVELYPPILRLTFSKTEMELENGTLDLVNNYSIELIEFILGNN